MRRPFARPLLAAAACSALLLTGCGTSDAPPEAETTAPSIPSIALPPAEPLATPPTAGQGTEPSAGMTETPATPAGTVVTIDYAGGEATGDTGRITVEVGEPITLKVTSDVNIEVHIHGADRYLAVEPGVETVQEFTQDAPGVYEVELHGGGGVLTRIQAE